ncbi:hypothetical protein GX50_08649 [[Emmonsia] crescens]|uniref:Uncharacterized protein n=1 Tax=[Emmonsia] crescens TaxID=73230 RepID=A0A2B7Z5G9_9EURO|nr:hypothetical protein GX50_08649 [Emmonsia crescens]
MSVRCLWTNFEGNRIYSSSSVPLGLLFESLPARPKLVLRRIHPELALAVKVVLNLTDVIMCGRATAAQFHTFLKWETDGHLLRYSCITAIVLQPSLPSAVEPSNHCGERGLIATGRYGQKPCNCREPVQAGAFEAS